MYGSEKKELKNIDHENLDLKNIESQVCGITGGIVIKQYGEVIIEPRCCGDIGNLKNWENIFSRKTEEWKELWIGHPEIFYRNFNQDIEFSTFGKSELNQIKPVLKISETTLKNNLVRIRNEQAKFEIKIRNTLNRLSIKYSNEIAKLMVS